MTGLWLVLIGLGLIGVSGTPCILDRARRRRSELASTGTALLGAAIGLVGTTMALTATPSPVLSATWALPIGRFHVSLDALSAVFLFPILLVPALCSVYGLGYWTRRANPDTAGYVRVFLGLLGGSLVMVLIARDGVLFLMAWEVMALSAFFLVVTEDKRKEARDAGWVYLVAAHVSVLTLMGMFAVLRRATGSFALGPLRSGEPVPEGVGTVLATAGMGTWAAVFALALLGFGIKAGIMPLHVWLPGAHASAPSHVSAVLSSVVLKTGVYGLARICGMLPNPPVFWGAVLLALGVISAVAGVIFALGQHDLKRLLAYHSVENVGIIVMGLGLAMIGRSLHQPVWIVLGLGGAILHVWNHGLFKALLFLAAGSVVHATHTREIDHLGGLGKSMPRTAALFALGAAAICGLPPLNGFVSELFIYLGLFHTAGIGRPSPAVGAAIAAPALAITGALALACFVKAYGAVFLGLPRSAHAAHAHEAPTSMLAPMVALAACCAAIGLAPGLFTPILDRAIEAWAPPIPGARPLPTLSSLVPVGWVSIMGVLLVALCGVGFLALRQRLKGWSAHPRTPVATWDCGYAAPSPTMQYSSSSFAQMLVRIFAWLLRPCEHQPRLDELFPSPQRFESRVDDAVLDGVMLPASRSVSRVLDRFRLLQQGRIQMYILYILITLLVLLLSTVPVLTILKDIVTR